MRRIPHRRALCQWPSLRLFLVPERTNEAIPLYELLSWALRALAVGREEDVAWVLLAMVDVATAGALRAVLDAHYRQGPAPADHTSAGILMMPGV